MTGFLALEDGTVFRGDSVGAEGFAFGEAVFTTSMTGYQEVVTDPSYAEQIVCFTAPMIGNYGVAADRCESSRPHARAVVMREARGPGWTDWLHERGIVALSGIDTRSLVVHLRDAGAMRAIAVSGDASVDEALAAVREQPEMTGRSLAGAVSSREAYVFSDAGTARIAVVDYGCKRSILDRLAWSGAAVTVYPHDADPDELVRYDGVLLSNGPGDPAALGYTVDTITALLGRVPVFGICLGHQLLATALGGTTYKLTFGHHGGNHPVRRIESGSVEITSQNHNYAVAEGSVPDADITHVNLNDGVVEGLRSTEMAAFGVQYHPEAGPGPHDAEYLFEEFRLLMEASR